MRLLDRFTEFKVKYHDGAIPGVRSAHAGLPVELPPDYDRVRDALERHVERAGAS